MVVVWFKRDLRLMDHEPLVNAVSSNQKIVLLYSFEPLWVNDPHYSQQHIDFVKQSLEYLNQQLLSFNTKILVVQEAFISFLTELAKKFP